MSINALAGLVAAFAVLVGAALQVIFLSYLREYHPEVWKAYGRPRLFHFIKDKRKAWQFSKTILFGLRLDLSDAKLTGILIGIKLAGIIAVVGLVVAKQYSS